MDDRGMLYSLPSRKVVDLLAQSSDSSGKIYCMGDSWFIDGLLEDKCRLFKQDPSSPGRLMRSSCATDAAGTFLALRATRRL
jgi:hypothetical protein